MSTIERKIIRAKVQFVINEILVGMSIAAIFGTGFFMVLHFMEGI